MVPFHAKYIPTVKRSIEKKHSIRIHKVFKVFRKYLKSMEVWTKSPDTVEELSNFSTEFYFESSFHF